MRSFTIDFIKRSKSKTVSKKQIEFWSAVILNLFKTRLPAKRLKTLKAKLNLIIVFVDLPEAQQLNKIYRKKNYATDVLSFSPVEAQSLGELVFCAPVLSRQAKEHGLTLKAETLYMLIHGLLHLLGYDHEKSATQARVMFKIQDEIFEKIMSKSVQKVTRAQ